MAGNDSGDEKLLLSKVNDTLRLAAKHNCVRYSEFLNPAAQALVASQIKPDQALHTRVWGGYKEAERKMFCAAPDWYEMEEKDFPIALIQVTGQHTEALTHRDFLGALMALGIRRETIGDIVIMAECSYIFCIEDMAHFILLNVDKIGRLGVGLESVKLESFTPSEKKVAAIAVSVASMRLDGVLAGALHLSRTSAGELIRTGRVNVNFKECDNLSLILHVGDLISIRGFGRFEVGSLNGTSKKGRIHLEVLKYL